MKKVYLSPLSRASHYEISLPGCLSYTIRGMALAAMTEDRVKIENALKSDDTAAMYKALKTLGIECSEGKDYFLIDGNLQDVKNGNYEIDINISGRSARTLLALLCITPGTKILTCKESFKKRPVGDMVEGLGQLGARIEYLEKAGFLPVKITSSTLNPGTLKINGSLSSQFISGILMIAPLVGEIKIQVLGEQSSRPFIDMTIEAMKSFGVNVKNDNYKNYVITSGQFYSIKNYYVEPDAISASYFWGIAAVTKSKIKISGLGPNSRQGDVRFVDILKDMGCSVTKNEKENWISVEGTDNLHGITVDMNSAPDSVQTLDVVAAFAKGSTQVTGVAHLKIKETDRIEAPKKELLKMGVKVSSTSDSITINGGEAHGAEIDTYGDHRMAMAFAVAGTRIPGIVINDPDVVSKSFPGFWEKIKELGIGVRFEE